MDNEPGALRRSLLGHQFSSVLKSEILNFLFGSLGCELTAIDLDKDAKWNGYFVFYSDQCMAVLNDGSHKSLVRTHQDFLEEVRLLQNPRTTRETIKEALRMKLAEPDSSNNKKLLGEIIDLAARIGSMTFVGKFYFDVKWQKNLFWQDGSLVTFLKDEFKVPQDLEGGVKLGELFTAHNLSRIGGINIHWTHNLADHLRMHHDDQTVSIFHHASFLKLHQQSEFFPRDKDGNALVEETLRTLSLLLPPHNTESKAWFKKQAKRWYLDVEATNCEHLEDDDRQIMKFRYWHDRLTILKEAFDDAEPKSVKQWWRDKRKPVQWYNFWLAIALIVGLTVFFGLIQSIEGALQVYKAYHPS